MLFSDERGTEMLYVINRRLPSNSCALVSRMPPHPSCLVLPCLALSYLCLVWSLLALSCLVVSCRVTPCFVLSCLVLCRAKLVVWVVLCCVVLSCVVLACCFRVLPLSYPTLSCLVLSPSRRVVSCRIVHWINSSKWIYIRVLLINSKVRKDQGSN